MEKVGTIKRCPKCMYHQFGYQHRRAGEETKVGTFVFDIIERECRCCGYVIAELPVDHKEG